MRSDCPKRILIIRLDRIGDVLLSTPAIKAVRDSCPDSHIAILVRPYARDIIEGNPYINEVIFYDKDRAQKGLLATLGLVAGLRKKRFNLAIVLHPTARSHLVSFLAGIPERIGYGKKLGILLTRRIPHKKQYGLKHEIDYTLDLIRYAMDGVSEENIARSLYIPVSKASEHKIEKILTKNGVKNGTLLIALHPGASCPSKRWPAEKFAAVADALVDRRSADIVIISGVDNAEFGNKVASSMRNEAINLSGQTSVGDLASLFRRTSLLISCDSGPVHVACAVGAPVVAIFGRSDRGLSPTRWGPTGERDIILHKYVGCDTCLAHNCDKGFKCLEAVTVEEVLAAAEKVLHGNVSA